MTDRQDELALTLEAKAQEVLTRTLGERGLMSDIEERFEWSPQNGDVIVPSQSAIAVYTNSWGQIVIRQEDRDCDRCGDGDVFVVIDKANIPTLIQSLQSEVKLSVERDVPTTGRGSRCRSK